MISHFFFIVSALALASSALGMENNLPSFKREPPTGEEIVQNVLKKRRISEQNGEHTDASGSQQVFPLLKLCDDLLVSLFSYLSFVDSTLLSLACRQMRTLFNTGGRFTMLVIDWPKNTFMDKYIPSDYIPHFSAITDRSSMIVYPDSDCRHQQEDFDDNIALTDLIKTFPKTTKLVLTWRDLRVDGAVRIASFLKNLVFLDLKGTMIGSAGIAVVATIGTLEHLLIAFVIPTDKVITRAYKTFAETLPNLKTLDVSHNRFGNSDEFYNNPLKDLGRHACIRELIVCNVGLTRSDSFCDDWNLEDLSTESNKNVLTVLDVRSNGLTDKHIWVLLNPEKFPVLKKIDLRDNTITPEALARLEEWKQAEPDREFLVGKDDTSDLCDGGGTRDYLYPD